MDKDPIMLRTVTKKIPVPKVLQSISQKIESGRRQTNKEVQGNKTTYFSSIVLTP